MYLYENNTNFPYIDDQGGCRRNWFKKLAWSKSLIILVFDRHEHIMLFYFGQKKKQT